MVTGKPFLTVDRIQKRVSELAFEISRDYKGKDVLVIGILKGAFMFFSDLVKQIQVPINIDFFCASSYAKSESTGEMTIHMDLREDVRGRHVLLIEDIIDTGLTLHHIMQLISERKPASLKVCSFLDKTPRRKTEVKIDYVGFEVPDKFLVGYGLDYENRFRNLPYIAEFKDKK